MCLQTMSSAEPVKDEKGITIDEITYPFGKSVELVGKCRVTLSRDYLRDSRLTIVGLRIDGKATQSAIEFDLFTGKSSNSEVIQGIQKGKYYKVRGSIMNARTSGLHALCNIHVKSLTEIKESPLMMREFEGRVVNIAGIASNNGSITLERETVKLSGIKALPRDAEGKKIEASGKVSKVGEKWQLTNANWRFVELKDLVESESGIALAGRLFSLNGQWYFKYRSSELFLTEMNGPPLVFPVNKHGAEVLVTGKLVLQKRPSLDQISLKEDRDLVPTYVIRGAKVSYKQPKEGYYERFGMLPKSAAKRVEGVPVLVAERATRRNILGNETTAMLYIERNFSMIQNILNKDFSKHREVIVKRMNNEKLDDTLRLIYATILARANDERGRKFLTQTLKMGVYNRYKDALYCLGVFPFLGGSDEIKTEAAWAEKLLIKVFSDPSRVKLVLKYSSIVNVLEYINSPATRAALLKHALEHPNQKEGFFHNESSVIRALCAERSKLPVKDLLLLEQVCHEESNRRLILKALLRLKHPAAAERFVKDLKESFFYMDFRENLSPEVLDAFKKILPTINDEKIKSEVQTLLMLGSKDPVGAMLKALETNDSIDINSLMYELKGFNDPRSIRPVVELLKTAPADHFKGDMNVMGNALAVIAAVGNRDSVRSLISLLSTDLGKYDDYIDTAGYHRIIAAYLISITGESFGKNQRKWSEWEKAQPDSRFKAAKKKVPEYYKLTPKGQIDFGS